MFLPAAFPRCVPAALLLCGLLLAGPAAAQPAAPMEARVEALRLDILTTARRIEFGMSGREVTALLRANGFSIEGEVPLSPDGAMRMISAVPSGDGCLPRGAPLVCPNIRVSFVNDPRRGPRVIRVEAFQTLAGNATVEDILGQLREAMGPPLLTHAWSEMVRGGSVSVWRQRWQQGTDGPVVDILATQAVAGPARHGGGDPRVRAAGVGYMRADPAAEAAIPASRRRLMGGG